MRFWIQHIKNLKKSIFDQIEQSLILGPSELNMNQFKNRNSKNQVKFNKSKNFRNSRLKLNPIEIRKK